MRINNIQKIDTLWYEDENGKRLDVDITQGPPEFPKGQKWYKKHEPQEP